MTQPSNRLTREQWIALLKDCASSNLSVRQYATLKNVGYSTLTKWSALTGISLRKHPRQVLSQSAIPSNEASPAPNDHEGINIQNNESFSFIDITNYAKGDPHPNASPTAPRCTLSEPIFPPSDFPPCGLEIRMPNGIILKVDAVPFPDLWPKITELVRAVAP